MLEFQKLLCVKSPPTPPALVPGSTIGPYEMVELRGEGAMVPMAASRPVSPAQVLFETSALRDRRLTRTYDVASDGRRFVLSEPIEATPLDRVHAVENWFEELARLVPVK